ncbi:MAG TPA: hypothetical protein VI685_28845 [Candidatus Angelobacter sp.]
MAEPEADEIFRHPRLAEYFSTETPQGMEPGLRTGSVQNVMYITLHQWAATRCRKQVA